MIRRPALRGASTFVLCGLLCAAPRPINAQTASQTLPPVTIDAPVQRQAVRPARKPPQRAATASRRNRPVQTATANPSVPNPPAPQGDGGTANASLGTPSIKQRYQLPQTSASITAVMLVR